MWPVQIPILFHPESETAPELAEGLFRELAGGAGDMDLRIPVPFYADSGGSPRPIDFGAAERTLAVVLVDRRMARRVDDPEAAKRWADLVVDLVETHGALPVALDEAAFTLDPRLATRSFLGLHREDPADRPQRLLFHVCAAALERIEDRPVTPRSTEHAPVTLFLSHAKVDLPSQEREAGDDDPIGCLIHELGRGRVDHWFDAKKIHPGGRFADEIESGVLRSSALIAIVTNSWSSREWCRREVLEAKEVGRPILIVDHITDDKPRLFPYVGNAPVVRWKDRASARKVVTYAVREALRYRHNVRALQSFVRNESDVVFGTKPELLSLSMLPKGTKRVLYPDPPLGEEELRHLRNATPVESTTPLTELTKFEPPPGRERIALSLSTAQDAARYGGSAAHLSLLAHDLNVYLMLAGFSIAYGGTLRPDGIREDKENYTESLFSAAQSHSELARQLGRRDGMKVIRNYVGWPIHLGYGDAELNRYGVVAELVRVAAPVPLGVELAELGVADGEFFGPTDAPRRFAWARGMTALREAMRDAPDIGARIVLGGKLRGYSGRCPGVLEEALLDLRKRRAVFLAGAFGGAARLVFDALRGEPREELTTAWVRGTEADGTPRVPFYDEVRRRHLDAGLEMKTPEELGAELATLGANGLAAALKNGLDDAQNLELATATDPRRIVELVLAGLRAIA